MLLTWVAGAMSLPYNFFHDQQKNLQSCYDLPAALHQHQSHPFGNRKEYFVAASSRKEARCGLDLEHIIGLSVLLVTIALGIIS